MPTPKTKPIDKKLKEFIRETARTAAWNIGLSEYTMDIHYMEDDREADDLTGMNVAAEIRVNRRYLSCTIRVYPLLIEEWERGDKKSVKECIVHEVAHLATEHMKDLVWSPFKDTGECKDAWESLTTRIGRMAERIDELEKKK
jgi:hypothetical protein